MRFLHSPASLPALVRQTQLLKSVRSPQFHQETQFIKKQFSTELWPWAVVGTLPSASSSSNIYTASTTGLPGSISQQGKRIKKKLKSRTLTRGLSSAASPPMEALKGAKLELGCTKGAPQAFVELFHLMLNLYRIFIQGIAHFKKKDKQTCLTTLWRTDLLMCNVNNLERKRGAV